MKITYRLIQFDSFYTSKLTHKNFENQISKNEIFFFFLPISIIFPKKLIE
jgi:hypothetical protein